ncbi:M48 family metalloprotease [Humisphaera borealis]|uniref:M48 family metalloprotease n=1 Tax=Humisphaera borealis TaxID=2807512 RepID=A0A7M2WS24_9BACT|nr:M48 family metalloprotease [Humisphaera borealis]QOV87591.1 M48 family metalloprotease [Humisphaera borealis]
MPVLTRPRRGAARLNISVIIALGIAVFGVIKFLSTSQVNPVTGEKQRVSLTPQQEVALGLQSAPQMAQQMGGLVPKSDPRSQFVTAVGQKLVAAIGKDHPWKFQFHLLADTKTVNAFALPGGQCFITLALFNQLQNEAQLAGVMGHEIGHVIHRHSAERIAKGDLGRSLVTAVGVGASGSDGGQFAHMAAAVTADMIQKSYGRDAELESDHYGVEYMTKAGYDPREMIGVMEILKKASGGGSRPEFTSTHPDPGNRAQQISEQVKQLFPQGVPPTLTKGAALKDGRPGGPAQSAPW